MANPPQRDGNKRPTESTPYGQHPHGVDEASGGADSSPFESEPSGEKAKAAQKSKEQRQATPDDGGDWCI